MKIAEFFLTKNPVESCQKCLYYGCFSYLKMELDFFGYLRSILIIKEFIIRCLCSGTVTEKNMKCHNSNNFREILCSGHDK